MSDVALDVTGASRLYCYASSTKLMHILKGESLRLSPYSEMNDPRESKCWFPDMTSLDQCEGAGPGAVDRIGDGLDVDWLLRRGAVLSCFTVDRERHASTDAHFHRGWARARMWDQYAERHRGACLVLDRVGLIDALEDEIAVLEDAWVRRAWGLVKYADEQLALTVDLAELRARRVRAVVEDIIDRQGGFAQLYFQKNLDWQSEQEFRIVVVRWNRGDQVEQPLFVPCRHALRAVIFGEDSAYELRQEAYEILTQSPHVERIRAVWHRGAPHLDLLT